MDSKSEPNLFVEINKKSFIFVAGQYDESLNFELLEKIVIDHKLIIKNRLIDINKAQEEIKESVQSIEKKIQFIFKDVNIILDCFEISCIEASGYKKLNGSQLLKENISYILNLLKSDVAENEKDKTILHIFNSKSTLDKKVVVENLPIGMYGNFYSHELTFVLIGNNDYKNIIQIFNKNNLNVKKISIKRFIEGIHLIENNNNETFFFLNLSKKQSYISFFDCASLRYVEDFQFGSDIILNDIKKVCSIKIENIQQILEDNIFKNRNFKDEDFLEEKYFEQQNFRKIRKSLILEIAEARIQEIAEMIINNNINLKEMEKKNFTLYFYIEDDRLKNNFEVILKSCFSKKYDLKIKFMNKVSIENIIKSTLTLTNHGWKKEAVPVIQTKNSLITKIFKSLFG